MNKVFNLFDLQLRDPLDVKKMLDNNGLMWILIKPKGQRRMSGFSDLWIWSFSIIKSEDLMSYNLVEEMSVCYDNQNRDESWYHLIPNKKGPEKAPF